MTGGMLAIWSDIAPERETDYLHWLTREHAAERVGIPGFTAARVFRAALPGVNRFLILYDLAAAEVVRSPAYLARLNAPTPWSQRTMPELRNFARGGGWMRAARGTGGGGHLLPLRLGRRAVPGDALLDALAAEERVCAVRLLEVDRQGSDLPTHERSLRGKDASFDGLLLVEATDAAALHGVLARHRPALAALSEDAEAGVFYTAVFALREAELAADAAVLGARVPA